MRLTSGRVAHTVTPEQTAIQVVGENARDDEPRRDGEDEEEEELVAREEGGEEGDDAVGCA